MSPPPQPTGRHSRLDGRALAAVLLCCVLWGINQSAVKVALGEVGPLTQAALRSIGATLLLMLWARHRRIPLFGRDGTLAAGVLAGSLFAAEFALIFWGLQHTHASRMIVFIYLSPFVVALGMPFIARTERLGAAQVFGLLAAFGGVALTFSEGSGSGATGERQWLGDAMGIGAAVLWGATTLVIRASRLSAAAAEKTLLYQLAVSALLLSLAAAASGEAWPRQWSGTAAWSLAFQIVIVTFASYLLWFWLVRHYPATRLAAFTLLTPLAGLAAGVLWLGEPATPRLLAGLLAVAAGIWLVNRSPAAAPAASHPPPENSP